MVKTVVGSFDTVSEAASAARDLRAAGFMDSDVSVIANNQQRPVDAGVTTTEPDKVSGAATGIVAGGALGGAAGLAASLMGLAIPGIGPILAAGPIAAALAGAGAGAVAGGLIGGLTDAGISETHAEYYAEAVRRGGALVTVRADDGRADEAEAIIRRHGAFDIEDRATQWKSAGWTGYNAEAEPYTFDEIERDRTLWRATGAGTTRP
jgi:hypothetical protein